MRSVDWTQVEASHDGDFQKLPAGAYVVRIMGMTDNESKQYVECVYDIAEGEHAGFYSDDWGLNHPFAHRIILSYKDSALGMLKGRLEAITESNPGFDAEAAWNGGKLNFFHGKLFGVNLQEEEYEKNDGSIGTRLNAKQVVTAQKVREGKCRKLPKKLLDGTTEDEAATPERITDTVQSVYGTGVQPHVDVPF